MALDCSPELRLAMKWNKRCRLKAFLVLALVAILYSAAKPFSNFGRGSFKKHLYEIILKLGHRPMSRCRLKVFYFLF